MDVSLSSSQELELASFSVDGDRKDTRNEYQPENIDKQGISDASCIACLWGRQCMSPLQGKNTLAKKTVYGILEKTMHVSKDRCQNLVPCSGFSICVGSSSFGSPSFFRLGTEKYILKTHVLSLGWCWSCDGVRHL